MQTEVQTGMHDVLS